MIPLSKIDLMNMNCRAFAIPAAILFSAGVISADAYTLPDLPPIPAVPAPAAPASIPMGDPASFAEVKMDFAIETNGPFAPTWTSIAANVPVNGTPSVIGGNNQVLVTLTDATKFFELQR